MIPSVTGLVCLAYLKFVLKKEIKVETVYAILIYFSYINKMMILANDGFTQINSGLISLRRINNFLYSQDSEVKEEIGFGI